MNTVSSSILDYLKSYKRAQVAGLGTFSMIHSGAKVVDGTKNILPPATEIGFVYDETTSDQGLMDYVSSKTGLSSRQITTQIEDWKIALINTREVEFPSLGKLTKENDTLQWKGERVESLSPDFFGLEEINLEQLNSKKSSSEGEYKQNKTILWTFLVAIPIAGILILAYSQRDRIFGKKSFDVSVKTSTHRIPKAAPVKTDSLHQNQIKADSANVSAH